MGLKKFFLEAVDDLKASDDEFKSAPAVENVESKDYVMINDLNMIHTFTKVFGKVDIDQMLVTRNVLFGDTESVKVKLPGFHGRMPLFSEGYAVDTNDLIIEVNDTKSSDGKYSQSIGIGEDVKITLRLTVAVSKKAKHAKKLIQQKKSYKAAIRRASERIMRLLINEKLLVNKIDQEDILDTLIQRTSEGVKLNFLTDLDDLQPSRNYDEIMTIADNLLDEYGIIIKEVNFFDIDLPESIKKQINDRISQQDKIKMKQKDADSGVYVAQKKKEAELESQIAMIEMINSLQEKGMSNEYIAKILQMYAWEKLPPNANVILGGNGGFAGDMLAANLAAQQNENTNGRSR
jgi:regulator of protease activity HflC (stomatin/prohibitin superfamily)